METTALKYAPTRSTGALETILHNCFEFIGLMSPEGIVLEANKTALNWGGFSSDEVIGKPMWATPWWVKFCTADDRSKLRNSIVQAAKGECVRYLIDVIGPEGIPVTFDFSLTPIFDQTGKVKFIIPEGRDITKLLSLDAERISYFKHLKEIFQFSRDGMAYLSLEGTFIEVNDSFCQLLGRTRGEILREGRCQDLTPTEYHDLEHAMLDKVTKQGISVAYEKEANHKDGHRIPVMLTVFPVIDAERNINAVGVIVRDISELKQRERELRFKAEALASSNKALEGFASIASHDLKEPLRTIGCFLSLLSKENQGKLEGKSVEYLNFALEGAKRCQHLIDDLLLFSRITTGKIVFNPIDGKKIVEDVLRCLGESIRESDTTIQVTSEFPTLYGDEIQLAQIFQNLLQSAIKYRVNRKPEIKISAEEKVDHWLFSISDNGIGIRPEDTKRIFELFHRAQCRSDYPGTGIGLAICKQVVERHGGQIWVESKVGEGSNFFFTLPKK